MKNPTSTLITRESLLTTASYNTRWFAGLIAGSAVLGSAALATNWDGDVSGDWNDNANWVGNAGNSGNAVVNTNPVTNPPFIATIAANATQPVVDIFVGTGNAANGRLDHTAGTAQTGSENWMFVGVANATAQGVYNLSNPAASGGTFTGHGMGSGSMTVGGNHPNNGNLYVGGDNGGGDAGTGVVNVNTSGTLTVRNDLFVGNQGGNGTLNLDNGTITSGNVNDGAWTAFGFTGGTGTLNMSGGTLISYGALWVPRDANSDGVVNLRGGTIETRTHGEGFVIGESSGTTGVVNHTGGTINTTNRDFIVGRDGGGVATYTLNTTHGASSNICARFLVATGAGTTGTANLDGGSLTTEVIDGGSGNGTVNFNGTQINATNNRADFISGLVTADIKAGGLPINTGAFNVVVPQLLIGTGGIVKTGTGTLTLNAANTYAGGNTVNAGTLVLNDAGGSNTTVNAGTLVLNAAGSGAGAITLANSTTLNLNATLPTEQLDSTAVTLGTTTLNLNRGDVNGANPTNALLNVTGAFTVNGAVTVNVAGAKFAVGDIPLIAYDASQKTGAGTFTGMALPNGVVATLEVDDNYFGPGQGAVFLDVTSVALPKWTGNLVNRFTTGSPSTASNVVTVANAAGIAVGNVVSGPGIAPGSVVTLIAGNDITLDLTPTTDEFGVNLMFSAGPGANPGVWDTTTTNWVDELTGTSSSYADPNPALFDDDAPGLTAVVLNTSVSPSVATFDNDTLAYSLSGSGAITGASSLVKKGTGDLTLSNVNTHDGATRLEGGTVTIATIEDLGTPSPIGDNSNLVIAGGTLNYTGAADTTTRGMTLDGNGGGINNAENLTFAGQVLGTGNGSGLRKQGAGTLTFTFGGANAISSNGGLSDVEAGTLVFDGTAGGQVNTLTGELWVASEPDVPAHLTVTNTTLNISSWLAVGRGNGNNGVTNINVTNSTFQTGNFSSGFNNGLTDNASEATLTITGSTWTNAGIGHLAESAGSAGTLSLSNSSLITNTGVFDMSAGANTTSSITISGTSELRVDRFLMALGTDSVANVVVENSGTLTKTGGSWMSIGNSGNGQGTLTVRDSGTFTNAAGAINVADVGTSKGILNIEDSATVTLGGEILVAKNSGTSAEVNISGGSLTAAGSWVAGGAEGQNATPIATITQTGGSVTLNGDDNRTGGTGTAIWNISAGSVSANGWMTLGRYAGGTGTMNASGGTVTQNHANRPFRIAEFGTGILNVSGTAVVSAPNSGGFQMGGGTTGVGTINIDGGTLVANRIYSGGNDAAQTVSLDGGTLQAATGANLNFVAAQIGTLSLDANNADIDSTIDTNGQTVAINKPIGDGGGNLIKSGAGTLQLNSANGYLGTTTVTAGTLGGNGSLDGPLQIDAGASVNPGTSAGTFSAFDSVNLDGTYICEIDGAVADQLAVGGTLTIDPDAILDFDQLSAPGAAVFIIASYGTLDGSFAPENVLNLPSGYTLEHNYLGGNQIALVQTATPYTTWASGFGLDPFTDGAPGFDKDNDGQINSVEFALGGSPISGSDNAKVFSSVADSNDGGSDKELLMTIAVRTGTGSFTGTPPSLTRDGFTYAIQGSTTLADFTLPAAVEVGAVAPPAPNNVPPAGYEWHTFKLSGSDGLPNKGFLRVLVTP